MLERGELGNIPLASHCSSFPEIYSVKSKEFDTRSLMLMNHLRAALAPVKRSRRRATRVPPSGYDPWAKATKIEVHDLVKRLLQLYEACQRIEGRISL